MDVASLAGLADDAGAHALADADEVMMDRADGEEHRDRHVLMIGGAVGKDQDARAGDHGIAGLLQMRWMAFSRPASPSASGQTQETVAEVCSWPGRERMVSNSFGNRMGESRLDHAGVLGPSPSQLRRQPMMVLSDITSFSRIGSMGGLVTWAKSCLK